MTRSRMFEKSSRSEIEYSILIGQNSETIILNSDWLNTFRIESCHIWYKKKQIMFIWESLSY